MTLADLVLVAGAGLIAGGVNAVAGGGTFFTFAALVAAGLPPVVANATSAVGVTPANVSSAFAYRREIRQHARRFAALMVVSFVGAAIGAILLVRINNDAFRALVPALLLFATVLFAISPWIGRLTRGLTSRRGPLTRLSGFAVQGATAIYGGFFGAGMGIMMLAALAVTEGDDYHANNAAKHLLAFIIQIVSVVIVVLAGLVSWPHALAVGVAAAAVGYVGVAIGRRLPVAIVRGFVVGTGLVLTGLFWWRG